MKQNELFNKCCENIDPKTREEVWKQMDKELGRTELEQAAGDYIVQLNGEDLEGGFNAAFNAFKAGAEWMAKQGVSYETELGWEIDGDRAFPELDPPVEDLLMPSDISLNFNDGDKVIVQIRKMSEL